MQASTTSRPKSFRRAIVVVAGLAALGATALSLSGVTPAMASELAQEPEVQMAVFLVPLILLMAVMLFEATRMIWRNRIPATAPARRRRHKHWPNQGDER